MTTGVKGFGADISKDKEPKSWIVYDDNTYRMITILDQIKERLVQKKITYFTSYYHSHTQSDAYREAMNDAIDIIDKYRRALKGDNDNT